MRTVFFNVKKTLTFSFVYHVNNYKLLKNLDVAQTLYMYTLYISIVYTDIKKQTKGTLDVTC